LLFDINFFNAVLSLSVSVKAKIIFLIRQLVVKIQRSAFSVFEPADTPQYKTPKLPAVRCYQKIFPQIFLLK